MRDADADTDADADGAGADGDGGSTGEGYLRACLAGYLVGCVGLEVAPAELTSAALPFLVPPMLVALGATLLRSGRLGEALAAAPESTPGGGGGEMPSPSSSRE